ncbi:unnamed protein product [Tilletia controversa]|nr:hypothetical protein CF336_g7676 [Tilletia laevis]CAD6940302.1 unnamed protein product [Tilletia controversa]
MSDPSYSSLVADDTDEWQPGPAAKRKAPAESSPLSKHTRGATRELSEAPGGSSSGSGTTSTGHNVTVSGSNITIAVSGQATTPADMALSNILTEAKFLHGSHSRQISGLQKKLANVAHNLQKKEDELSDQLAAYGRLEGKYEALKTGLGHLVQQDRIDP